MENIAKEHIHDISVDMASDLIILASSELTNTKVSSKEVVTSKSCVFIKSQVLLRTRVMCMYAGRSLSPIVAKAATLSPALLTYSPSTLDLASLSPGETLVFFLMWFNLDNYV